MRIVAILLVTKLVRQLLDEKQKFFLLEVGIQNVGIDNT